MKLIKVKCKDAPPSLDLFGYKWYKGKQRGMNAYWTFSKKHKDIVLFIDDNPVKQFLGWNPVGGKDMVECWRKWQISTAAMRMHFTKNLRLVGKSLSGLPARGPCGGNAPAPSATGCSTARSSRTRAPAGRATSRDAPWRRGGEQRRSSWC